MGENIHKSTVKEQKKPDFIVMLTYHDETVSNAGLVFEDLKNTPVSHWGVKDVGLPQEDMRALVSMMNSAGKTTYLEVVSLTESEGICGAELALELGFDILMGTVFFESIADLLRGTPVKYYPFLGEVSGHPSVLGGTIPDVVDHARSLEAKGANGLDLLTYRYTGDAPQLMREVVRATTVPVVSAGSISTYEQIAEVWRSGARAFTIGTACFEGRFVRGGSFEDNLMAVWQWLQNHKIDDAGELRKVL